MNDRNKGKITVYIWDFKGFTISMGHASMSLSDGTHISWWPIVKNPDKASEYLWTAVMSTSPNSEQNLDADIEGEGRNADLIVEFPSGNELFNEAKIRDWWTSFKNTEKYHLRNNNCSTVIYKAFEAGGITGEGFDKTIGCWTPLSIRQFVAAIYKDKTGKKIASLSANEDEIIEKLDETHIHIQNN